MPNIPDLNPTVRSQSPGGISIGASSAAGAPGRAVSGLGSAIAQTGQTIDKILSKKDRIKRANDRYEAEGAARKAMLEADRHADQVSKDLQRFDRDFVNEVANEKFNRMREEFFKNFDPVDDEAKRRADLIWGNANTSLEFDSARETRRQRLELAKIQDRFDEEFNSQLTLIEDDPFVANSVRQSSIEAINEIIDVRALNPVQADALRERAAEEITRAEIRGFVNGSAYDAARETLVRNGDDFASTRNQTSAQKRQAMRNFIDSQESKALTLEATRIATERKLEKIRKDRLDEAIGSDLLSRGIGERDTGEKMRIIREAQVARSKNLIKQSTLNAIEGLMRRDVKVDDSSRMVSFYDRLDAMTDEEIAFRKDQLLELANQSISSLNPESYMSLRREIINRANGHERTIDGLGKTLIKEMRGNVDPTGTLFSIPNPKARERADRIESVFRSQIQSMRDRGIVVTDRMQREIMDGTIRSTGNVRVSNARLPVPASARPGEVDSISGLQALSKRLAIKYANSTDEKEKARIVNELKIISNHIKVLNNKEVGKDIKQIIEED